MVNNVEFGMRLKIIMDYYQLSASAFADKIQVQRSSISHLLSGRNRPSLDFVMKVIKEFDKVELYWLLNGKGEFPKRNTSFEKKDNSEPIKGHLASDIDGRLEKKLHSFEKNTRVIERIVIFYKDGSFKEYLK
jgi:transcriptional regulator with XRE-family HTH domain